MKLSNMLFVITLTPLILIVQDSFAEQKSFRMGQDFCEVEIRAGNSASALNNPVIYPMGSVKKGQIFTTDQTFIYAQREGNPGVCNSGRAYWNSCSWDKCELN